MRSVDRVYEIQIVSIYIFSFTSTPSLFAHFVRFLSCFVRFVITCTLLPFPCFIYFYLTVQCRLTHVDFALSVSLLSILALPYTFWCLSCFTLSPIFSLSCQFPFSSFSFSFISPVSFFASFSGRRPSAMKIKTGKTLRSQVTVVLPFLPIPQFWKDKHLGWSLPEIVRYLASHLVVHFCLTRVRSVKV